MHALHLCTCGSVLVFGCVWVWERETGWMITVVVMLTGKICLLQHCLHTRALAVNFVKVLPPPPLLNPLTHFFSQRAKNSPVPVPTTTTTANSNNRLAKWKRVNVSFVWSERVVERVSVWASTLCLLLRECVCLLGRDVKEMCLGVCVHTLDREIEAGIRQGEREREWRRCEK